MSLSFAEFALRALGLLAFGGSILYAASGVRAWLLPGWSGAPARLADAVTWVALVAWTGELLGLVGLLAPAPLLVAGIGGGVALGAIARARSGVVSASAPPAPRVGLIGIVAAAMAVALVLAAWAIPTAQSFAGGIDGADSVWYHLPQAARFAQTGSIWDLHFSDPYFLNWFYPQTSELLHAIGMVIGGRDLLSPLVNGAFLGLGLLAAWCVGRPWGLGAGTLVAASLVFGAQMTVDFQAGEARNDVVALALLVAAVALIVNARVRAPAAEPAAPKRGGGEIGPRALALAAVACGLAAGTKLSLLAPAAFLTLGVIALAGRGARARTAAVWLAGLAAGGGFWYLRNLVHSGNPLPWIDSLGLPAPERALELRPEFSVSHYLTDGTVWDQWLIPGLRDGLGPLWALSLVLAIGASGFAIAFWIWGRRRRRQRHATTRPFEGRAARAFGGGIPARPAGGAALLAMLGAVALASIVAYLFTPLTASGEEGEPVGFLWNLRYLGPGLALGLLLVPLLPPLRRGPWRWLTLAGLLAMLCVQVAALHVWDLDAHQGWALACGLGALTAFALVTWISRATEPGSKLVRAAALAGVAAALALIFAGGWALQRSYFEHRYENAFAFFDLDEAISWANETSDVRIATAGRGGVFVQYPFYGPDLSNHVQWVGVPGPHGAWLPAEDCSEWRAAVNDGDYDYVLTTYDDINPGGDRTSVQREWIEGDPAATEVLEDGPVALWALSGELDPGGCA